MDSTFVDYLNSLGTFSIGTFIAVTVVIAGFIVGLVKGINKLQHMFKDYVAKQLKKEEQTNEMMQSLSALKTNVETLQSNIDNLSIQLTDVKTELSSIKEESSKGDVELRSQVDSYIASINNLSSQVNMINSKTNLLIESDKESIKSYITDKYYDCIAKGFIEVHTLQTVECMYEKYLSENGNTFISNLMSDLRKLPHDKIDNRRNEDT